MCVPVFSHGSVEMGQFVDWKSKVDGGLPHITGQVSSLHGSSESIFWKPSKEPGPRFQTRIDRRSIQSLSIEADQFLVYLIRASGPSKSTNAALQIERHRARMQCRSLVRRRRTSATHGSWSSPPLFRAMPSRATKSESSAASFCGPRSVDGYNAVGRIPRGLSIPGGLVASFGSIQTPQRLSVDRKRHLGEGLEARPSLFAPLAPPAKTLFASIGARAAGSLHRRSSPT